MVSKSKDSIFLSFFVTAFWLDLAFSCVCSRLLERGLAYLPIWVGTSTFACLFGLFDFDLGIFLSLFFFRFVPMYVVPCMGLVRPRKGGGVVPPLFLFYVLSPFLSRCFQKRIELRLVLFLPCFCSSTSMSLFSFRQSLLF